MVRRASTVKKSTSNKKKSSSPFIVLIGAMLLLLTATKCVNSCTSTEAQERKQIVVQKPITKIIYLKKGKEVYFDFGREIDNAIVDYYSPQDNVELSVTSLDSKRSVKPFQKKETLRVYNKKDRGALLKAINKNAEIHITF